MRENSVKLCRSALALLLVLAMMVGVLPAVAFAATPAKKYVSLGDGATGSFDKVDAEAYPAQVAAEFGWELTQLATGGMRAEDLRYALTAGSANAYPADAWTEKLGLDTAKIQSAVSQADVITLAVGNANFGTYLVELLTKEQGEGITLKEGLKGMDAETQGMILKLYDALMEYLSASMPEGTAKTMGDRIGYAVAGFLRGYNAVLDRIVELNPDAEIIIVGLLNAAADTDALNGLLPGVDAVELMDILRTPVNTYMVSLPMMKKYSEATVYYVQPENIEMQGGYPSAAGHDALTAAIVKAYKDGCTVDKEAPARIKDALSKLADRINELIPVIRETDEYKDAVSREYICKADSYYVAIGDDSVRGSSYVNVLKKELGVSAKNLGKKLLMVEDTFAILEKNKDTVAKADLITIGYTNNNFLNAAIEQAMGIGEKMDWAALVGAENVPKVASAMEAVNGAVTDIVDDPDLAVMVAGAVEGYAYSLASYMVNMPKLVDTVRQINPDALVVIVGMHNPLAGLTVQMDEETAIPIGQYLDYLTTAIGVYGNTYAMLSDKAIYVAAPAVETVYIAEGAATTVDVVEFAKQYARYSDKFLPSEAGHQYIAEQILNAIANHRWQAATCTAPETCKDCGETRGEALPHTWVDATETAPKTCSVCGVTEGDPLGHTHVFDKTVAEDAYKASDATCTAKATYYKSCACGEKGTETFESGELAAHTWVEATCTAPKTCSVCKATEGEPLAHIYAEGKCTVCGAVDDSYVPGDVLLGDANGDGAVNAKDAMLVLQYYTKKLTEDKLNLAACDVDGNGTVNAKDAMLILQKYTKKLEKFPVEV